MHAVAHIYTVLIFLQVTVGSACIVNDARNIPTCGAVYPSVNDFAKYTSWSFKIVWQT